MKTIDHALIKLINLFVLYIILGGLLMANCWGAQENDTNRYHALVRDKKFDEALILVSGILHDESADRSTWLRREGYVLALQGQLAPAVTALQEAFSVNHDMEGVPALVWALIATGRAVEVDDLLKEIKSYDRDTRKILLAYCLVRADRAKILFEQIVSNMTKDELMESPELMRLIALWRLKIEHKSEYKQLICRDDSASNNIEMYGTEKAIRVYNVDGVGEVTVVAWFAAGIDGKTVTFDLTIRM